MSPRLFDRLIASCADAGFRIDEIEYCGQGEPLSNPHFSEFVRLARSAYPGALQRLITNGNYDFGQALKGQILDEVVVSCDGLWQSSYEQYRVHGSVSLALQFMADAASLEGSSRPFVVWKYILFEFNDSPEELLAAQEKAVLLGVDKLVFVVTHSKFRSRRWTVANAGELPISRSLARVTWTPALNSQPAGNGLIDGRCGSVVTALLRRIHARVVRRRRLRRYVARSPLFHSLRRELQRIA